MRMCVMLKSLSPWRHAEQTEVRWQTSPVWIPQRCVWGKEEEEKKLSLPVIQRRRLLSLVTFNLSDLFFFFFVSLKELLLEGLIFHHRWQRWRRWRRFHLKSAPETRTLLKNRFILLYYQFSIFLVPPAFRRAVPTYLPTYLLPFLNVSKKESLLSFTRQSVHPLVELVL